MLTQRNLPNRRTLGKQNPYCIARIAHEAKSSPPDIRGGQIPKWDHEVRFNLRDNSEQKQLKLTVLDKNDSKPELIGDTVLDLQPVFDSNPRDGFDQWHELTYKGKYAGEVYLEMTFYPTKPNIPPKVERQKKKKKAKKKASNVNMNNNSDPLLQSTMSAMSDLPPGIVPAGTGSYRDPRAFDQYVPPGYNGHASVNASGLPSLPNQSLPNHSMPAIPSQPVNHSVYGAAPAPPPMASSMNTYPMGQSMTASHSMHALGHTGHSRPLPEAVPERSLPIPEARVDPRIPDPRMAVPDPRMSDPRLPDPRMPDPRQDPRMDPRLSGQDPRIPTTPSPYREPLSHSRSADPIRRQGNSPVAPRYAQGTYPSNGSPLRPSSAGYDQNGASSYGRPSSAGMDMPSASTSAARHDIPEPLRQSGHGRRSWGAGDSFPQAHNHAYNHDPRHTPPLRVNRSQNGRDDDLDLTVSMLKNSYGGRSVGSPGPPPAHVASPEPYGRDRAYDRGFEAVPGPGGQPTYSPRGSTGSYTGQLNSSGYSPRTSTNSHMTSSTNTMYSDDDGGDNQYKRFLNHKAPALDLPKIPTSPAQGQYGFSVKRKPVGSGASPEKPSTPQPSSQGDVMSYAMQRKMATLSLEDEIPFSPDSYSKPNNQHHPGTHADNPNGLSGDDILDVSTYAPEPARGATRRLPTVPAGHVDPGHAGYKGEGQWDISDQLNAKYSDSVFHAVTQKKKNVSRPPPPQDMYRKPELPPKIPLGMTRDEYYVAEPEYDGYQGY